MTNDTQPRTKSERLDAIETAVLALPTKADLNNSMGSLNSSLARLERRMLWVGILLAAGIAINIAITVMKYTQQ